MRDGKSYSGREANKLFLNLGSSSSEQSIRYADISGISGFDYKDDTRGLALADWDFDGDLDIWCSNRTSPSVRFLKNNSPQPNKRSLTFHLNGNANDNRDAIGARLTLTLKQGEKTQTSTQIVRAGGTFISQSSKWLHFGIPQGWSIEEASVTWPSGSQSHSKNLTAGHAYSWVKGRPPELKSRPLVKISNEGALPLAIKPTISRSLLSNRPLIPELNVTLASGEKQKLNNLITEPTLVTIWASWCPNCSREFTHFKTPPFPVLALNIDDLSSKEQRDVAQETLKKWNFSGSLALLDQEQAAVLDYFQRELFSVQSPLSLPTSFLVDQHGRAIAIYRGGISPEQILADIESAHLSDEDLFGKIHLYPGIWIKTPRGHDPLTLAGRLLEEGLPKQADNYLTQYIQSPLQNQFRPARGKEAIALKRASIRLLYNDEDGAITRYQEDWKTLPESKEIPRNLGQLLLNLKRPDEASTVFKKAAIKSPADADLQNRYILSALLSGKNTEAALHAEKALHQHPRDAELQFTAGLAFQRDNQLRQAVRAYKNSLQIDSGQNSAANNLAWIQATSEELILRDLHSADQLIRPLIAKNTDPSWLLYLRSGAAIYAAKGRYEEAQKLITAGLKRRPRSPLAPRLRRDLKYYQSRRCVPTND